ncbi:uncharacterized protein Z518_04915 [Rhinocladiella mackenziei CBS 650.93]|uniref:Uncharacterized protein n=1 Tax=Rhinocladiella mackenziei CBS 650.93 TaxID=1442369 RepID=A0A0D2IMG3_9EURO|nr:uncharacterized protein Z518_04915 [Rhinocladiella mackenziei CBS 650.93]KIX06939.1 hypothetical protein Z518_04915 [Rhinocladiella mackenziei CBS 650.93]
MGKEYRDNSIHQMDRKKKEMAKQANENYRRPKLLQARNDMKHKQCNEGARGFSNLVTPLPIIIRYSGTQAMAMIGLSGAKKPKSKLDAERSEQ